MKYYFSLCPQRGELAFQHALHDIHRLFCIDLGDSSPQGL